MGMRGVVPEWDVCQLTEVNLHVRTFKTGGTALANGDLEIIS